MSVSNSKAFEEKKAINALIAFSCIIYCICLCSSYTLYVEGVIIAIIIATKHKWW